MIKRPMKAESRNLEDEELYGLKYPVVGSAKLDGVRAVVIDGVALSSTLKPIRNEYIQRCIGRHEYDGFDGELIVGDADDPTVFNKTIGPVMRKAGRPDFTFHVFDRFVEKDKTYEERWLKKMQTVRDADLPFMSVLKQAELYSPADVLRFEKKCVDAGYEGAMIRSLSGIYKEGRCTKLEQNVMKRKPMCDIEGRVVGFGESMTNENPATINEIGETQRGTDQNYIRPSGSLGFLILKSDLWEKEFKVGAGAGTINEMRDEIWANKEKYLGKMLKFSYQPYGSVNGPRLPIAICFRDEDDITDY